MKNKYGVTPVRPAQFPFIENNLLRVLFYCIVFLALSVICLIIGVIIGYSILGSGNMFDVFDWKTWQHILDFLK